MDCLLNICAESAAREAGKRTSIVGWRRVRQQLWRRCSCEWCGASWWLEGKSAMWHQHNEWMNKTETKLYKNLTAGHQYLCFRLHPLVSGRLVAWEFSSREGHLSEGVTLGLSWGSFCLRGLATGHCSGGFARSIYLGFVLEVYTGGVFIRVGLTRHLSRGFTPSTPGSCLGHSVRGCLWSLWWVQRQDKNDV